MKEIDKQISDKQRDKSNSRKLHNYVKVINEVKHNVDIGREAVRCHIYTQ